MRKNAWEFKRLVSSMNWPTRFLLFNLNLNLFLIKAQECTIDGYFYWEHGKEEKIEFIVK